jgi:hypothetical protein
MIERDRRRDTPRCCLGFKARSSDWDSVRGLYPLPGRRLRSNLPSIRIGQAVFWVHFLWSRRSALAMTISFRITAVMASFLHFPTDISCPLSHMQACAVGQRA